MTRGKMLRISEASQLLGVSVSTLRRMEEKGSLAPYGISVYYTPTGRRRYSEIEIAAALDRNAKLADVIEAEAEQLPPVVDEDQPVDTGEEEVPEQE